MSIFVAVVSGLILSTPVASKPSESPSPSPQQSHALEILKSSCRPLVEIANTESPMWICTETGFEEAGLAVIDLEEQLEKSLLEARYSASRLEVSEASHQMALGAWYRQWTMIFPIGVMTGVVMTYLLVLALQ